MNKDVSSESVDLQSINRKLDQIISFISGLKGSAPVLSGIKAPKFPLPAGTTWYDIVIKLAATFALISLKKTTHNTDSSPEPALSDKTRFFAFAQNDNPRGFSKPRKVNFVELDCYDKLRKSRLSPDRHWKLLQRLAEHDGELPWRKAVRIKHRWSPDGDEDDSESTELIGKSSIVHTDTYSAKEISRVKKTIQGLRQKLKAFFGLSDDPFYSYEEAHTYKTKFQLMVYNPDEWKSNIDDLSDEDEPEPEIQ